MQFDLESYRCTEPIRRAPNAVRDVVYQVDGHRLGKQSNGYSEPKVEHHDGRGVRSCPLFPELRKILDEAWEAAPEGAEYIVDKPSYRAAANTGVGWRNANLRTQFLKILKRAGVSPWRRLFHSMRASRQTELEKEFPLHVVCAWLGNSPRLLKEAICL